MKPDASHIKQIKVISNTHWDREFRKSFEKTRRNLITMLDTTLDILEKDPKFHSFTMDGHSIMIDDYLEMRPERLEQVKRFVQEGRLVIGPYYTLSEEFSISQEAIVRNLIWGRKTLEKYGGKTGTVAYTPSSWGQTGQLPQILSDFGLSKIMFYRGISHHESDAEFIWSAPDGTRVLASRFAIYARYNWYYQVHRAVTTGRIFEKDYVWGQFDEIPFRLVDNQAGEDQSFVLKSPEIKYDKAALKTAIEIMVETEGPHFTTEVFLAMNGHDISVAYPLESKVIDDAKELLNGKYEIEHTDLEKFWSETEKLLDLEKIPVLTGERRAYLKQGMWTFLFPGTISARSYLKQQDFKATNGMVYSAEPLATLSAAYGAEYPSAYINRSWQYLLSNHTHDANGGCAPDTVCKDMEYRYRKVSDIGDIVTEDSMSYIAENLSPEGVEKDAMQLVVYNPLPFERDAQILVDLEVPTSFNAKSVTLESKKDSSVERQFVQFEKSSSFVDSIWDVPTILETSRMKFHAKLNKLPALGYRVYTIKPQKSTLRNMKTLVTGPNTMENRIIKVTVNNNGTIDVLNKLTGKLFKSLNYLSDQGECGNAWKHVAPVFDRVYSSLGVNAHIAVTESGPLTSTITAEYSFGVPEDYADGKSRSDRLVELGVKAEYTLEVDSGCLEVRLTVNNTAKDHWLRAYMPTCINSTDTWSDSHFDVIARPIKIPDSTDWVEQAGGTHPLRSFVGMSDGKDGIALFTKGLFEYEAFEDQQRSLALTLIRACRIKLAVSEEKQTELPDPGVQCQGLREFEYAINFFTGACEDAQLLNKAAEYHTPIRCAMMGRGKGTLEMEGFLFSLQNLKLHIAAVKMAEDGSGIIIRLFNPLSDSSNAKLNFGKNIISAKRCKMDESEMDELDYSGKLLNFDIEAKKIVTLKIILEGMA